MLCSQVVSSSHASSLRRKSLRVQRILEQVTHEFQILYLSLFQRGLVRRKTRRIDEVLCLQTKVQALSFAHFILGRRVEAFAGEGLKVSVISML